MCSIQVASVIKPRNIIASLETLLTENLVFLDGIYEAFTLVNLSTALMPQL